MIFLFKTTAGNAQVSGDYGAYSSGSWGSASTWKVFNGISWASSPVAVSSPNSSTINTFILPGITVQLSVSQTTCRNITINSTGKLYTNSAGSNVYLYVYGNITCDGTIGNGATFDAISFGIEGASCLFTGTGSVDCSRIRKNLSVITTTQLTIDININLKFATGSQTQIYNSADGTIFNVTVNAGKTITLTGNAGNVGNVAMDGIAGNDIAERGGTYTINGTMIISGTLYLTTNNGSLPCNFIVGTTGVVQTLSVIANTSGSAKHTLTMNNGGLLQITGTPFTNPFTLTNNIYNLNTGSTIEYAAAGAQTIDCNVTYANLKTSGTGNKTGAGPLNVSGNVVITGTSVLVPYSVSPLITVGGNWTNYATAGFTETGSSVTFNGSANQTITCAAGENFNNLIVNKPAGKISLSSAPATIARVAGTLNLTSGNILTATTSYVLIQATGNVINVNNNSFVEGPCGRQGNTAFVFPIGKTAKYRPLGISAPPVTTTLFIAEYFQADPQSIPTTVTAKDPTIDHVGRCEYWYMRASVSTSLILTPSWDTYTCGVATLSDLIVSAWSGSLWKDLGNNGTTGNTSIGTVTALSAYPISTSNIPITISTITPDNPLPIELISFQAKEKNGIVDLDWVTATEINNDYFQIERSEDGVSFETIHRIYGAGTTTIVNRYSATDNLTKKGIYYYRLKQTDYDGQFTYSDIVAVDYSGTNTISFYPNPVQNKMYVLIPEADFMQATISVFDLTGKLLFMKEGSSASINEFDLEGLAAGIYYVSVISDSENLFKGTFLKD